MFGFFFTDEPVVSHFEQVTACNMDQFRKFYHGMLDEGIYLAPSAYETGFMSMAHQQQHLNETVTAARKVLATLGSSWGAQFSRSSSVDWPLTMPQVTSLLPVIIWNMSIRYSQESLSGAINVFSLML